MYGYDSFLVEFLLQNFDPPSRTEVTKSHKLNVIRSDYVDVVMGKPII
jgi:hypothetical protein